MRAKSLASLPSRRELPETEELQFGLAHRLEVAIWIFDIDKACIMKANAAACRLWQAETEDELCSRKLGRDMSSSVRKRLLQYQSDFRKGDTFFTELWTLYPNDEAQSVMVTYRGFPLADGRMAMQCEVVNDKVGEPQNVRSAEALLHTDVLITLFQKNGPSLYLNPAARNVFEGPIVDLKGLFVDVAAYYQILAQADLIGEHRIITKLLTSRGVSWFDVSVKTCLDAVTGQPAVLMTAIDVSELKEARDLARKLADRDQLTNLHNRAYLHDHLADFDGPADSEYAIIFFDVDRFKLINDRYGHEAGDCVLKVIANRTSNTFRKNDLVCRLGGDEFVILVEGPQTPQDLQQRISRLRAAIADPIMHGPTRIDVSISVGVSRFKPASTDLNQVLREADMALYASKDAGRDRVTFFTFDMGVAAKARTVLEIELKKGIEDDEFILHYQPRFDVALGKVIGVEGLARWQHPTRGLISPGEFISVCEETGMIEDLGRKLLALGCNQAIAWHKAGLDLDVSINISPRQFVDPDLIQTLADLAEQPGFPKGRIELEVTENVLIGDPEAIAEKLKAITKLGYLIAIDDFGTGYSNLSYISRFPLSCLKIDRTFVSALPKTGPIVQLILSLAKQIEATVVSEGVETQAQLDWLREHDCEQVQGHLIAAPMAVPELEVFIASAR